MALIESEIKIMEKEQLTWPDISVAAASMFNIMGTNNEIAFAQKVWQNLSGLNLTSYSNNLELIKLKILFVALGDLYKDFCKLAYNKQTKFNYNDLLKLMDIDEYTLGRFYQATIKPKENKLPNDFSASKALEEFSKFFRKEIYQLLLKSRGSTHSLILCLWRAAYPYSDQDNFNDIKILFTDFSPANDKAQSWINLGCYILLDSEEAF